MDRYQTVSQQAAQAVIRSYSSSFRAASSLLSRPLRTDIANIYALVRVADEIVDSYTGQDAGVLLDTYEKQLEAALVNGFSTDIIIQAFVVTARKTGITIELTRPFFNSMRMDLELGRVYDKEMYDRYVYGSAEAVGLMCLRVFMPGSAGDGLSAGARALGSAFQKINFLRDLADDHDRLGRYYFPFGNFETFNDTVRQKITDDIRGELAVAGQACRRLPRSSRYAAGLALIYFETLLDRLERAPAAVLRTRRLRINAFSKLCLLLKMRTKQLLRVAPV